MKKNPIDGNPPPMWRIEEPGRDFPFYADVPIRLSVGQWGLILLAVSVGFGILIAPIAWPAGPLGAFLPAILFPAIPIGVLALLAGRFWRSLFGPIGGHELKWMVLIALLNIVVSMLVGALVWATTGTSANPIIAAAGSLDAVGLTLLFAKTVPQLFGEEVITILPFLAMMQLFTRALGLRRNQALFLSWVLSAVMFGLLHLPSYEWNWIQCVVIIGSARLVLSLAYIKTKNILVSTGAHVLNDWMLISLSLLGQSLVSP